MKKFIATISYFGGVINGSAIRLVEASTKSVAQKRAEKYAAKDFSSFERRVVIVEELTPAKAKALNAARVALEEEYQRIAGILDALNCVDAASKGYLKI